MKTLQEAIAQFKASIKKTDYEKVKGNRDYLGVAYRLKFCREFFGERLQILTKSVELSNGSHKFIAEIFIDNNCLAVGESKQMHNKEKDFEKTQTVAIGRGLAFLGFMGDEIASKEEMDQFYRNDETIAEPKEENKPSKTVSKNITQLANDWISQMQTVAKHSKSQLYFEKNLTPIKDKYKDDLLLIAADPIEQLRVDTEYNKLKSQIQSRGTNGR
jgi:hypothetical protein